MADIIVREYVATQLAAILPKTFKIEKYQRIPDVITKPTAILKQQRIGRAISTGQVIPGARVAEFVLTLATQYEKIGAAESALDDTVVTLLNAIDDVKNIRWTAAEKRVLPDEQTPCYDITIEFPYTHDRS